MRYSSLALIAAVTFAAGVGKAKAESREAYLDRLRTICEVGCMRPRELLRVARKTRGGDGGDMADILDIVRVSREGNVYRLHTGASDGVGQIIMRELDFGMPENKGRPVSSVNHIVIEFDEDALYAFVGGSTPRTCELSSVGSQEGGLIVEGDRNRTVKKPTVRELEALFRSRRVVVRGQPRLDIMFTGARRDYRRKQLTLVRHDADDLALLPRYDEDGDILPEK